jgi:hypothetical protein
MVRSAVPINKGKIRKQYHVPQRTEVVMVRAVIYIKNDRARVAETVDELVLGQGP